MKNSLELVHGGHERNSELEPQLPMPSLAFMMLSNLSIKKAIERESQHQSLEDIAENAYNQWDLSTLIFVLSAQNAPDSIEEIKYLVRDLSSKKH